MRSGVLLYATATNNTNLRNFARMLVAIEQDGAKTYWHMDPAASSTARDNPYPEQGLRNLVTIGTLSLVCKVHRLMEHRQCSGLAEWCVSYSITPCCHCSNIASQAPGCRFSTKVIIVALICRQFLGYSRPNHVADRCNPDPTGHADQRYARAFLDVARLLMKFRVPLRVAVGQQHDQLHHARAV